MSSYVHLEFEEIKAKTDKALLIMFEDGHEYWIPLSQIEGGGADYKKGDMCGTMCVSEWFCKKEGIV